MNLKAWLSGVFVLLTGMICYGQKISDNVSKEICQCIEQKLPTISDNVQLKDSVNACLGQGMATDMNGLLKEYKMNGKITVERVREVRDRLWRKLEENCESFKRVASAP